MNGAKYFVLLFLHLFVCGFAQYYNGYNSYPYGYFGNYPVSSQGYYRSSPGSSQGYYGSSPVSNQGYYRSSPCRSSCGNVQPVSYCHHLPCYSQQSSHYAPSYWPYSFYNSRSFTGSQPYTNNYYGNSRNSQPFVNYYSSLSQKSSDSDPYAGVPVEIIDDDSIFNQRISSTSNKHQDQYINVPVEIIDDDSVQDSWKDIPILPKANRTPQSNYTVSHGEVTSNSVVESKPIQATITRSFHPKPQYRIDFLNGEPIHGNEISRNANQEDEAGRSAEVTTIKSEEIAVTETNEVTEVENEEVAPVKSWWPLN